MSVSRVDDSGGSWATWRDGYAVGARSMRGVVIVAFFCGLLGGLVLTLLRQMWLP